MVYTTRTKYVRMSKMFRFSLFLLTNQESQKNILFSGYFPEQRSTSTCTQTDCSWVYTPIYTYLYVHTVAIHFEMEISCGYELNALIYFVHYTNIASVLDRLLVVLLIHRWPCVQPPGALIGFCTK